MDVRTRPRAWPTRRSLVIALVAGVVVFLLLFRGGGTAAIPPTCYSLFGYEVPCDPAVAWLAGAGTIVIVLVALWVNDRRSR